MATFSMKQTRYAHSEGHVDLTFDQAGKHLLTCGSDGDLRIYEGFDDDDPISHRVGDVAYSVVFHNNRFYVSSDDNAVQVYTFKDGEPDGIVTRFMAPVTHMVLNTNGTKLVAGSSDFSVKLVEIETSSQKVFQEHDAPILSVALHPKEHLLASSSCDGTIKIWQVEEQKCIKTIPGLPKTNDFCASTTLCRLTWSADGQYLIVPIGTEVRVYDTTSWQISFILTDSSITQNVSITRFSPCWKYLIGACRDGQFVLWDFAGRKVIHKMRHDKKFGITAVCWNPNQLGQVAYCDNNGGLGLIDNIIPDNLPQKKSVLTKSSVVDPTADLFDDDDDDMLVEATNPVVGGPCDVGGPMTDDDDDDECDIGALKKRIMGDIMIDDDDENSKDTDITSVVGEKTAESLTTEVPRPVYTAGYEPTPLQPPFQSSSCPAHLSHRFMVWNSVGIIVQYNTDEENSINIEFHDTAVHHAMHVTNTLNHTMAALSNEAVILACVADEDAPSKLVCMHFASWDNNKEWSVDMPSGEEIKAVCLGEGWVAVATDKRTVRLFSIGGVQKETISIPGPIVTLAGHSNQLIVVYHAGMGIPGDQCLGVRLQTVSGLRRSCKLFGEPLPLSPKSTLAWTGFSAEGTPFIMDSQGVLRMLNRANANSWIQVANLKKHCKGKSDSYWLCGLHENPQQIRAILCKGSRYPPTLPRPTIQILPYQLPVCELDADKGAMEESLLRSRMLSQHLDWWDSQGYEVDDTAKTQALMPQQEALMKLFALACKSEREYRAVELCELMPNQHTVQLAIKYASRLRMMQLAQKLTEVARQKAEEELIQAERELVHQQDRDDDDDEHVMASHTGNDWSENRTTHKPNKPQQQPDEDEMEEDEVEEDAEEEDVNVSADIYEELDEEAQEEEEEKVKPMLKFGANKTRDTTPKSLTNSQGVKKNPFKVGSQQKTPVTGKGTSVFDSMEKPKSRSNSGKGTETRGKDDKKKKTGVLKNKGQSNLFASKKTKNQSKSEVEKSEKSSEAGYQLWLEANKEELAEEHPDKEDISTIALATFNDLSAEKQQEWNNKAKSSDEESRKRKREVVEDQEDIENKEKGAVKKIPRKDGDLKQTQSGSNKLRNFAFSKS